jgi:2-hydroxychromene-2-carboxylate isomerase
MTAPQLEFWFELASTYSYPAAMRIGPLAQQRGVALRWRPFLLGPIFKAHGWADSPFNIYPAKGRYMWRDLTRLCASLGLPLARPGVFPQNTILAARIALVGLSEGWGEEFCRAAYRAEFGEGRDIGNPATLAEILAALRQDSTRVLAQAQTDEIKSALRAQTDEAQTLGIFGAPSFVTRDGELFWGNDRLEAALDWARR